MDPGEQRRVRLENWAAMAGGWEQAREERERVAAPVTEWLVRELAPKAGSVVLEVAEKVKIRITPAAVSRKVGDEEAK